MPNYLPMSSAVFELLCIQAEAGRSIDLAGAGLRATIEQARTLVALMNGSGTLSLHSEGHDDRDLVALRLLGCRWVDDKLLDRESRLGATK